jgi:hypothetical protein
VFLIGLLGALGFMTLAFAQAYYQRYKFEQEINQLKEKKKKLETKKLETLDLLQYIKSPDFVEQKAYTELHRTKPGEQIVIITTPTATFSGQASEDMIQTSEENIYMKWWHFFFKPH